MVSARRLAAIAAVAITASAGCATSTEPGPAPHPKTPPGNRNDATLAAGDYPLYCLMADISSGDSTRASILGIPADLMADSDPSSRPGWPTDLDVIVENPTAGNVARFWQCDNGHYFDLPARVSISDDGGQRWLHFTFNYEDSNSRTIHKKIDPSPISTQNPYPVWYQSAVENNGLQFFVYMTAKKNAEEKLLQNYRVEIFSRPNSNGCLAEIPQFGSTVIKSTDGTCPGIIFRQNGVGAGNEPR